ncbi:uncharacterized protein LOC144200057 [Stigmatopora nigra]
MTPVNLGVKALVTWVNSVILTDREINIEDLKDGDIILRVISLIKNESVTSSVTTTEERFERIAEFVQKDCRFSPTNDTSLSWENIKNGINLTVEIAKLLLLLVYHDMMNERSTLKSLECEVEREIANLTGSFVMESFGCVYLKSGLDAYLTTRHLSVDHETLDQTSSTSLSPPTVSSLSDEDSPVLHLTPKVTFLDMHTVASSSLSKSPLQDIMNTPKFQLRKLQRQIIQEREYRDGLERELNSKISLITSKESHINRLEYNLGKMKAEQNNQEQNTKEKIDELESQIDSLQLRLNEILKEYKDFKSNSSLAERKMDELEEEKGILSSQVRASYAQLSTSQTEVSRLKETLASCQEEWRTKIDYLNSELNQATSQKDVMTEQVQILQGKISCLEDDLKAARKEDVGENMGPVIERDELECEIVHLKSELENTVSCLKKAEANEDAKTRELSAYAQEISKHNRLLKEQNLHIETLVQSKADIMKELQKEISEQREALQKKIDYLQFQLDQAEQQKAGQIQKLMERQKGLEKQVDLLILEKERLVQANQAAERENMATLDREEMLKKELELLTREKAKLLTEMEKFEDNERLKKQLQEQLLVKTEAVEDYKAKKEILEQDILKLKTELDSTVNCLKTIEANEEEKTHQLSFYEQEIAKQKILLDQQSLNFQDLVRAKDLTLEELQKEMSEQSLAFQKKIDQHELAEQHKVDQIIVLEGEKKKALEERVAMLILERDRLFEAKQATDVEHLASLEQEKILKKELESLKQEQAMHNEESDKLRRDMLEQLSAKTEAMEDYKAEKEILDHDILKLKTELDSTSNSLKKIEASQEEKTQQLSLYEQEIAKLKILLDQQSLNFQDLVRAKDLTMEELQKEMSEQSLAFQKKIDQHELAEQHKVDQIILLEGEKKKALEERVAMLILERDRLFEAKQATDSEHLASLEQEKYLKKELESLKQEQAMHNEESDKLRRDMLEQLSAKTEAMEDYKAEKEILDHDILKLKTELDSTVNCLKKIEASEEEKTHQLSFYEQEIAKLKILLDQQSLNFQDLVRAKDLTMEELQKEMSEQSLAFQKKIDQHKMAEQHKVDQIIELEGEKKKALEERVAMLILERDRLFEAKQATDSEHLASLEQEKILKKELESLKQELTMHNEESDKIRRDLLEQLSARTEAMEDYKAKKEILEHDILQLKTELDSTSNSLKKIEASEEEKTHQLSLYEQEIAKQKILLEQQSLNFQDLVRAKDLAMKELQKELSEQSLAFQKKIDKHELAEQHKVDQIIVLEGEKKKALDERVAMLIMERDRLFEAKQATDSEHLASLEQEKNLKKELESLKQEQAMHKEESDKIRRDLLEQLSARTEAMEDYKAKKEVLDHDILKLKTELDSTVNFLKKIEASEEEKTHQLSFYEQEIAKQKILLDQQSLNFQDLVRAKDLTLEELQKEMSEQSLAFQKKIDQHELAEQHKVDQIIVLEGEKKKALEERVAMLILERDRLFEAKQATDSEHLASLEQEKNLKKELESLKQEQAMHKEESDKIKRDLLEQLSARTEAMEDYEAERENLQCEIVELKNQLDKTVGCLTKAAADEEAKELKLSSYEEEIAQQKKLLALENLHTNKIIQSKDHIIKRLEEDISQQREALQQKIDHLKLQFEQAEQQKANEISVLQEEQKALEKQVDMLVVEKEKLFQTKQATERENMASLKMEELLKKELELLKLEKVTFLKEKEQEQASERLKIELQEQLFAKSEAVQHYKAQVEKAVSHYNDKKQLLHESQEEVANLKHSLEVREKEVKAASMENKLLQMELEKAQSKEKNMLSTLARLEAQVAYGDLNLRAQNRNPGHEGGVSELYHTKIEPKRNMTSDSLDRSSLEESLNNTRKLSVPDESSTPLIRSSERLAAKRAALKDDSLETLYFTPINTRHRTNNENKTEMGCAFVNPSSSVKRRRTTQVINITLTKKTPGGGEDDETFYSLTSARSHPNLSSATGIRPISMEPFETPGRMTAAGSDQLSGLPGYRRSTLHSQTASTYCVGAENEPDGASDDWMRIAELQARNKACLPHLKSSYPVEFENGGKSTFLFTDEEVRTGDPTETIRRASLMPGQLQRSVAAHRHSLAGPQSIVSTRSNRLSLMADPRPSKLVSSSQLRSPRCQKQSALTFSVPLTSPEKKIKASCFPRPLTPKNKNSNTLSSSSQLHAALSPADRRQSMVFTIDNTPKSNRSNYLRKGLNKLRSSTRKSPGKAPKRPPVNYAHKENIPSTTSIVAPGGKSKSFKSPQVKDNRKSPKPGGKPSKSPRLTASTRKIKT